MIKRAFNTIYIPKEILVISSIVIFTILFSVFALMDKSLRLDEVQSVAQTNHSFVGTLHIIAQDVHVPLYFIGLRSWEMLFGMTPEALRSFSLLFLLLSFPALYILSRDAYSKRVALFAVILAGVSPFLHWFGSEARMYTMLFLVTAVSQLSFIQIWKREKNTPAWALYAFSALLGVMTHYFFVFVLLVQALFYLSHIKLFPKHTLRNFIVIAALVCLEFGAWFYFRYLIGTSDSNPLLTRPSSIDIFNVFSHFFIGLQSNAFNSFFLSLWPLLVFAGFTVLSQRRKIVPETLYFLMSVCIPIALVFIVSTLVRPLFLSRYLIICLPSVYVLTAYYITLYQKKTALILFTLMTLCIGIALFVQAFSPSVPANENFKDAAVYVTENANASDIFVVTAPFTTYPIEYYYRGEARLMTFPLWERFQETQGYPEFSEEYLEQQALGWSDVYEHLYILMSYDQGYEEATRIYLDTHYQKIESREFSPGMNLYVYKLRYLQP